MNGDILIIILIILAILLLTLGITFIIVAKQKLEMQKLRRIKMGGSNEKYLY